MDGSTAQSPNNFPPSLQQQLNSAARQVPWSQGPPRRGQHQHYGPGRRGSSQHRSHLGTYPNQGASRDCRPAHRVDQLPRTQPAFPPRRGQSARGSHNHFQPFPNHQNHRPITGYQLSRNASSTGPLSFTQQPLVTQQPLGHPSISTSYETLPVQITSGPSSPQIAAPSHQKPAGVNISPLLSSSHPTITTTTRSLDTSPQTTPAPLQTNSSRSSPQMSVETAQAFYQRASSGAYRHQRVNSYATQRSVPQTTTSSFMTDQNAAAHQRLYNPGHNRRLAGPNPLSLVDINQQCLYLKFLADRETNKELNGKELVEKESFRKELERMVQKLVADYATDRVITINPKDVRLKCYGSLASGFAVPGSDMDLLLMFPKDQGSIGPVKSESRRMIEKAFLDYGYGARLLTKTRVPILRVCQNPNPELLAALRKEREKWEEQTKEEAKERAMLASGLDPGRLPSDLTDAQSDAATVTFAELDTEPSIIPLPPSPARAHANLEYKVDVGIQCDINFSNHVAIHNTALLRCYCKCDPRVRPMGLFVKEWSKARKINTPYHGTLSSYGYIMMVLHYLMNITQPPVIPNLQHLAKDEDAWNNKTNIELFEGFDIRFIKDERMLERRAQEGQMTKNRESLGSLLRGFFYYYTDNGGFHWLNDVISIRTQGGILTKKSKDWTETRRGGKDNSVKLRYVFAIEDPFEIDHNIARTVGFSGLIAIRNELRRARNILSNIKYDDGRWSWYKDNGEEGEDLFQQAEDRGDLLRQDHDFYREKMKRLRECGSNREAESKSASNCKSILAQTVDGRFPKPSHPNGPHEDANVSSSRPCRVQPKLINPARALQNPMTRTENNRPREGQQVRKTDNEVGPEASATDTTKHTSEKGGLDVSKWIESTAEACCPVAEDATDIKKTDCDTRSDRQSPQGTAELKENIADAVGSATNNDPAAAKVSPGIPTPNSKTIRHINKSAHTTIRSGVKSAFTIDPTNPLSAWNLSTVEGRRLDGRDRRIRARCWNHSPLQSHGSFDTLNRLYPYNAARALPDSTQQRMNANIRAKRNRYFDLKKIEDDAAAGNGNQGSQIADSERKDSGISIARSATPPPRKSESKSQYGRDKEDFKLRPANIKTGSKAPSTSDFTLALSTNNPEVVHNPDPLTDLPTEGSSAPLQEQNAHEHNARDCRLDLPIPSIPDFQFDAAQLRDLGIIAQGGSGCARDPMEQQYGAYDYDGFRNVELSNEWGGGGRMGEIFTDSGELSVLEFDSAQAKTVEDQE